MKRLTPKHIAYGLGGIASIGATASIIQERRRRKKQAVIDSIRRVDLITSIDDKINFLNSFLTKYKNDETIVKLIQDKLNKIKSHILYFKKVENNLLNLFLKQLELWKNSKLSDQDIIEKIIFYQADISKEYGKVHERINKEIEKLKYESNFNNIIAEFG